MDGKIRVKGINTRRRRSAHNSPAGGQSGPPHYAQGTEAMERWPATPAGGGLDAQRSQGKALKLSLEESAANRFRRSEAGRRESADRRRAASTAGRRKCLHVKTVLAGG